MEADDAPKPLVWLHGEILSPPFTRTGRVKAGWLLRRLQDGEILGMPISRPMPSIGPNCHELRLRDGEHDWRIVYRLDVRAVLVLAVFAKTTRATPKGVIDGCQHRMKAYDEARRKGGA